MGASGGRLKPHSCSHIGAISINARKIKGGGKFELVAKSGLDALQVANFDLAVGVDADEGISRCGGLLGRGLSSNFGLDSVSVLRHSRE